MLHELYHRSEGWTEPKKLTSHSSFCRPPLSAALERREEACTEGLRVLDFGAVRERDAHKHDT